MDIDIQKTYGIDFERGLRTCMGDLTFYKKILTMFLDDRCFSYAEIDYSDKNYKALFSRMHELKGISGNTALMSLYNATMPLVEYLRLGDCQQCEVEQMFNIVKKEYERVCKGIKVILAQA